MPRGRTRSGPVARARSVIDRCHAGFEGVALDFGDFVYRRAIAASRGTEFGSRFRGESCDGGAWGIAVFVRANPGQDPGFGFARGGARRARSRSSRCEEIAFGGDPVFAVSPGGLVRRCVRALGAQWRLPVRYSTWEIRADVGVRRRLRLAICVGL